jgi:hypothetical protein
VLQASLNPQLFLTQQQIMAANNAKHANPHFSPGSREQARDGARLSHPMDEPSLDL